jgi:pantoate--beta-alanine ligase
MTVWRDMQAWQTHRRQMPQRSIGFVPTMGALHRGHASLVERSVAENDATIVSIFVNPTQFNDPNDLTRYPRTTDTDLELLERLRADHVIVPSGQEMYSAGYRFRITAPEETAVMEGIHRPGFFEGVMTVVMKLLGLASAHRAYFGEKDYQQYRLIAEMVRDFFISTEIIPCPTVRTCSGLADSSRNALLSDEGRERAACIYEAITSEATAADAKKAIARRGLEVEYVEDHWGRRFAAARLEKVRLIDNAPLR